jgi:hypothetical protein
MSMMTQENMAGMSVEPAARSVPLVAGDTPAGQRLIDTMEELQARERCDVRGGVSGTCAMGRSSRKHDVLFLGLVIRNR